MRRFVPGILFLMLAAFSASLYLHYDGDAATAPVPSTPADKAALKANPEKDKAKPAVAAPAQPPALRRTLRTVALGWEFLTPGVIANGGSSAGAVSSYKMAGVDASFLNAPSMEDVESALAKGGAVPGGADIAIMPLSSYVASYEKLRALSPEVIFAVARRCTAPMRAR
jgi:hypothetical protein